MKKIIDKKETVKKKITTISIVKLYTYKKMKQQHLADSERIRNN